MLGCLERDNFDRHRSTACAAGCFRTILTDLEVSWSRICALQVSREGFEKSRMRAGCVRSMEVVVKRGADCELRAELLAWPLCLIQSPSCTCGVPPFVHFLPLEVILDHHRLEP